MAKSPSLKHFEAIQHVPSVPFVTVGQIDYISKLLKNSGYKATNNNYSLIVNDPSNFGKQKLVIMCHTDHPGMVLKDNHEGLLLGSVGINRLEELLKSSPIKIKIFSKSGNLLGFGEIIRLDETNKRKAYIKTNIAVPTNSLGQYIFKYYKESDKKVSVYNADNGISVATMLALLSENKFESQYDVYFVFNLHEEVHQISSWYLAKNNTLGLKSSDLIVNLECLKIENVDKNLSSANYNDGLVLQLSNTGCLFGYKSTAENMAEKLVKYISKKEKIHIQTGVIKDSCDSRPFSYFNLTPNIVTLTVPNLFKHNEDISGNIVPEEIFKKDVEDFYNLIKAIIETRTSIKNLYNETSVSKTLKIKDQVTNKKLMEQKAKLNNRLDIYYKWIIKRGYFFSENLKDFAVDKISSLLLYLTLIIQNIFN